VVASKNGDRWPTVADTSGAGSGIVQIGRLLRCENVTLSATANRPSATPLPGTPIYPFSVGAGTSRKTFDKNVVEFNSQGEARTADGTIQRIIGIGIQSAIGGKVRNPGDYVAIEITGLSGNVTVYRP
jgi:hypothetical protein